MTGKRKHVDEAFVQPGMQRIAEADLPPQRSSRQDDMERLYRRIIALETAVMGSLQAPYESLTASQISTMFRCGVMDHPANEYKPGHCYCTAKER